MRSERKELPEKLELILNRIQKDIKDYWGAVLLVAGYLVITQYFFGEICPTKLLFGLPCPGCGLTRGCVGVLTLRWDDAFSYNAASFLWVALIAYGLWKRYISGKPSRYGMAVMVAIGLITIGYYAWRVATAYPGVEPMTYNSNCLWQFLKQFR